jgi:thioredoxin 1
MTSKVLEATEDTFEEVVIESPVPVLVDFWRYSERVRVVKVNMDNNPRLAARFAIRAIPSVMLVVKGKVDKILVGVRPRGEYQRLVEETPQSQVDSGSFFIGEHTPTANGAPPS